MSFQLKIPHSVPSETRIYMRDLIKLLNAQDLITELDSGALKLLMQVHEKWIKSTKIIEDEGYVIADENARGTTCHKPHPALTIQKDATIQLTRLFAQFGLTPQARKKIGQEKPVADSPLAKFIKDSKTN